MQLRNITKLLRNDQKFSQITAQPELRGKREKQLFRNTEHFFWERNQRVRTQPLCGFTTQSHTLRKMNGDSNTKVLLVKRPGTGMPDASLFKIVEEPIPEPADGQVLLLS
jgi:hypothetical protein